MNHSIKHPALLADLKRLPEWETTYNSRMILGKIKDFYVRVMRSLNNPECKQSFTIEFADKKTFDRWANSVNFKTENSYRTPYRNDLMFGYQWAVKVNKSKLFHWNTYFSTIELIWKGIKNN